MDTAFAKDLDHEVRAAIQHFWMLGEMRVGIDEALNLDNPLDPVQRAERRFNDGKDFDARLPRIFVALLRRKFRAEPADRRGAGLFRRQ